MQRRAPNKQMTSSKVKTIMNPHREGSKISVRQKSMAVVVRVKVWGPLSMALRMVVRYHSRPISTGNPW